MVLALSPPLVGQAGSPERRAVEASVFLSAMMFLSQVVDQIGLDEVDVGSYSANHGSI